MTWKLGLLLKCLLGLSKQLGPCSMAASGCLNSWVTGLDSKIKCSSKEAETTYVAFLITQPQKSYMAPLLPHSTSRHHQSAQIQRERHRPHFSVEQCQVVWNCCPRPCQSLQEIWNWDWDAPSYSLWVLGTVQWRHGGCGATEETDLQRESSNQGSASSCPCSVPVLRPGHLCALCASEMQPWILNMNSPFSLNLALVSVCYLHKESCACETISWFFLMITDVNDCLYAWYTFLLISNIPINSVMENGGFISFLIVFF